MQVSAVTPAQAPGVAVGASVQRPSSGKPLSRVTDVIVSDPQHIDLRGFPPSSGPDGRFQVQGQAGKMTLVVVGDPPTVKQGLLLESGNTIDVVDVTVDKPP